MARRNVDGNGFEAVPQYEIVNESDLWSDRVVVSTRFTHSIDTEAAADANTHSEAIQIALKELGVAIGSNSPPVFNVEDTEINLHNASTLSGTSGSTIGEVLLELESSSDDSGKSKERYMPDVLNLDAFMNLSGAVKEENSKLRGHFSVGTGST